MRYIKRSLAALFPVLLLACSGDSSTNDAGPDATTDDVTTQDVSTQDVTTQDSGGQDGGTQDAAADASDAASDAAPSDAATDGGFAELCVSTGGTVSTAQCCKNTTDFPSTCTVGPCGCSPQNSHTVQTCNCPTNKCFTQQQGCH